MSFILLQEVTLVNQQMDLEAVKHLNREQTRLLDINKKLLCCNN